MIISSYNSAGTLAQYDVRLGDGDDKIQIFYQGQDGYRQGFVNSATIAARQWYNIVWVNAGNSNDQQHVYINNEEKLITFNNFGSPSVPISGLGNTAIGQTGSYPSPNDWANGMFDEVRVSSTPRSAPWVTAEYANQVGDEDFLTISNTEESTSIDNATTSSGAAATVTLKKDRPLSFSSLTSFTVNNGGEAPKFQLSNDAGKSWLFYAKNGWSGANPKNPSHRSSSADISAHLPTFPTGSGKLLWKAYLPSGTTLDQIQISYIPGAATGGSAELAGGFSATIQALNDLFKMAFDREPTIAEWTYWAKRMLTETKPLDGWLGAMQWSALHTADN
jgi:hypothetical protein